MSAHLLDATKRWHCPACEQLHETREHRPHTPFHGCPKLGILAPFVEFTGTEPDRSAARLVLIDREDYLGDEVVRTDVDGRPWMAVETQRADGSTDRAVFVPTATNRR